MRSQRGDFAAKLQPKRFLQIARGNAGRIERLQNKENAQDRFPGKGHVFDWRRQITAIIEQIDQIFCNVLIGRVGQRCPASCAANGP